MGIEWRPDNWEQTKRQIATNEPLLQELVGKVMELGAKLVLNGYVNSKQFEEDASTYCYEAGWKEPDQNGSPYYWGVHSLPLGTTAWTNIWV